MRKPSLDPEKVLEVIEQNIENLRAPVRDLEQVQSKDPFKILVATILSSRTKDEVTTKAAKRLFARARSVEELAALSTQEIEQLIYPVGFYRNKARFLTALPIALQSFGGRIPSTMERLLSLPGVGRKTANLVLARAFGKPAICVDTHVHRLANLWGWAKTKNPQETEQALKRLFPQNLWPKINPILVSFGQSVCKPAYPNCNKCPLKGWCPGNTT